MRGGDASIPAGCTGLCGLAHVSHDMWALGGVDYIFTYDFTCYFHLLLTSWGHLRNISLLYGGDFYVTCILEGGEGGMGIGTLKRFWREGGGGGTCNDV